MLRKTQTHGRIGEAATTAKCWMNGIRAYNTGGLRPNFAGSDLIVETDNRRTKLWIQVKTGWPIKKDHVYLTQCAGEDDLAKEKFVSDFVVFVSLDPKRAAAHQHDGRLGFEHLSFFVVPCEEANRLYLEALKEEYLKPKRDGSQRKLANIAVHIPTERIEPYRDAWQLIRDLAQGAG
jgi:hypothetical protein